jgi:hypothetical protein
LARSFSRVDYLVGVRVWFGLDPRPAIPDIGDMSTVCGNVGAATGERAGERCPAALGADGRHALTCKLGGAVMVRHNLLRDGLGHALRALVTGVWWERVVPELQRKDGKEARLDLVVEDHHACGLLDVVVFYPLRPDGVSVYKHLGHENRKADTYPVTQDGRRLTNVPLVPIVVNVFGKLNQTATTYLETVEQVATQRGRPFRAAPGGPRSLAGVVAVLAVMTSARIVRHAFSRRKREHAAAGVGRAPAAEAAPETCTTCGKLVVAADGGVCCDKCLEVVKTRRRHRPGPGCLKARCACPGRAPVAAPE